MVDDQILYAMVGTKKQFLFKTFNLGLTLDGATKDWTGGRLYDIAHSIRPLPAFDMKRFPYIIGLGMGQSRIILTNVNSRNSISLVSIIKKSDFDGINDLRVSCKT